MYIINFIGYTINGDKMEKIRNKLYILALLIFTLFLLNGCTTKNDSLRLRIIASSNSEIDQQNKIEVKEAIKKICEENPHIKYFQILDELKKKIKKPYINTITVEYKNETYPAKSYNDEFIPSGTYPSIVITIGEGKGKNFWTLLYPDFFKISFDDNNEIEYRSYIYDKIKKK